MSDWFAVRLALLSRTEGAQPRRDPLLDFSPKPERRRTRSCGPGREPNPKSNSALSLIPRGGESNNLRRRTVAASKLQQSLLLADLVSECLANTTVLKGGVAGPSMHQVPSDLTNSRTAASHVSSSSLAIAANLLQGKSYGSTNPVEWEEEDVLLWLEQIPLSRKYSKIVRRHHIRGQDLLGMRVSDWQGLGVRCFGDLRLLEQATLDLALQGTNELDESPSVPVIERGIPAPFSPSALVPQTDEGKHPKKMRANLRVEISENRAEIRHKDSACGTEDSPVKPDMQTISTQTESTTRQSSSNGASPRSGSLPVARSVVFAQDTEYFGEYGSPGTVPPVLNRIASLRRSNSVSSINSPVSKFRSKWKELAMLSKYTPVTPRTRQVRRDYAIEEVERLLQQEFGELPSAEWYEEEYEDELAASPATMSSDGGKSFGSFSMRKVSSKSFSAKNNSPPRARSQSFAFGSSTERAPFYWLK
eukprot:TRINITY_DN5739_c0_g1_i1.p1 TRINITY_DN5739_c0_g1~~TRINITY_DN5739_c0_g1_i1.p1  ORF type:complete len:476 (-),score=45.47 TRINITY_DN5739_c0_g1_i1:12-1439(-)